MEHELEGARKRQEALNNMEKGVRAAIGWRERKTGISHDTNLYYRTVLHVQSKPLAQIS